MEIQAEAAALRAANADLAARLTAAQQRLELAVAQSAFAAHVRSAPVTPAQPLRRPLRAPRGTPYTPCFSLGFRVAIYRVNWQHWQWLRGREVQLGRWGVPRTLGVCSHAVLCGPCCGLQSGLFVVRLVRLLHSWPRSPISLAKLASGCWLRPMLHGSCITCVRLSQQ